MKFQRRRMRFGWRERFPVPCPPAEKRESVQNFAERAGDVIAGVCEIRSSIAKVSLEGRLRFLRSLSRPFPGTAPPERFTDSGRFFRTARVDGDAEFISVSAESPAL